MDPSFKPAENDWYPCPPGVFASMLTRVRRRWMAGLIGSFLVAATGLGCVIFLVYQGSQPAPIARRDDKGVLEGHREIYAHLCCSRVRRLARKFLAGSTSADLAKSIENHLQSCEKCRDYVVRARRRSLETSRDQSSRHVMGKSQGEKSQSRSGSNADHSPLPR